MKKAEISISGLENTVGKEEIDRYEQFLLSHSVFKRLVLQTRKKQGLFGKGLIVIKSFPFFSPYLYLAELLLQRSPILVIYSYNSLSPELDAVGFDLLFGIITKQINKFAIGQKERRVKSSGPWRPAVYLF